MKPIRRIDGYLPIEDHGLIGNGAAAALVGRDGSVSWLCAPRFDSVPIFCDLLDHRRGGRFRFALADLIGAEQRYVEDTGVLVTHLRSPTGALTVTDALGPPFDRSSSGGFGELLRSAVVTSGTVSVTVEIRPWRHVPVVRGDAITEFRTFETDVAPPRLHVDSNRPLTDLETRMELRAGDHLDIGLSWGRASDVGSSTIPDRIEAIAACWRAWARGIEYRGDHEELVRRSAITLKLLDHVRNGAMVAAPTSSLPEAIGGGRNWDYRYAWIRDAAFSVYALRRIGLVQEARAFLGWILDVVSRDGHLRVLYGVDGQSPEQERIDDSLEGYRRSGPVRWGNAAGDQVQHDVYGEILDCAYQWGARGEPIAPDLWSKLRSLTELAAGAWRTPDQGIWEIRASGEPFTYSAALCQVALDRASRLSRRQGLPGDPDRWELAAKEIQRAILSEAWDPHKRTLTAHLRGGHLDAGLLALPLRRVLPARHPAMEATTAAIRRELDAGNGLLYRYLPERFPDGLAGEEGAFLLCSFWLVDNLALQGRFDEARELFDSLCGRTNQLGLLAEQVDPRTGIALGNFPQAFSHVGLISSAVNLAIPDPRR